jgi:hypothetical protein
MFWIVQLYPHSGTLGRAENRSGTRSQKAEVSKMPDQPMATSAALRTANALAAPVKVKALRAGKILARSWNRTYCFGGRALSSVVEHYLHTVGVAGSKPAARTIFSSPQSKIPQRKTRDLALVTICPGVMVEIMIGLDHQ